MIARFCAVAALLLSAAGSVIAADDAAAIKLKTPERFRRAAAVTEDAQRMAATEAANVCAPLPDGATAWFPGDQDDDDTERAINLINVRSASFEASASVAPGLVGQAFSFDGTYGYVRLPPAIFTFPSQNPTTFEVWFKTTAGGVILGQQACDPPLYSGCGGAHPAVYVGTDGKLRVEMFWKGSVDPITSAALVNDNAFHHVAVVFDGTTETVYLDGVVIGSAPHTHVDYGRDYEYQLGTGNTVGWPAGNNRYFHFNGLIDEPTFYSRALTAGELQVIYDAGANGKCRPGSCPPGETPHYNVTQSTGSYTPAGTNSRQLGGCDDCRDHISLSFPVVVYGQRFDSVDVTSNGTLEFSDGIAVDYDNVQLPATSYVFNEPVIFAFWDDLRLDDGDIDGVYTKLEGTFPNRVQTIEWRARNRERTGTLNFAVRFFENSPLTFELIFGESSGAFSGTIGSQNKARDSFTQIIAPDGQPPPAGTKFTFSPQCVAPLPPPAPTPPRRFTPFCAAQLDAAFGEGGRAKFAPVGDVRLAQAMALQADGKIVVAGEVYLPEANGGGHDFAVSRYNPDGSLDTGFGTNGYVTTDFVNSSDAAYCIAVQPDGKILVGGEAFDVTEPGLSDFAVARYNPDGSLDSTWGGDGRVTTDVGNRTGFFLTLNSDTVHHLAVQPDGKVVAVGSSLNDETEYDFTVVRYNPDGSLDGTFGPGGGGIVNTEVTWGDVADHVFVLDDGKLLVAGISGFDPFQGTGGDFALIRYNPDGSLDKTFGTGGKATYGDPNIEEIPRAFALQPDGKIITGGDADTDSTKRDILLLRHNTDGTLDPTFGNGGVIARDYGAHADSLYALAVQPDGKIKATAGLGTGFASADFALLRLNADGSPDGSFGAGGIAIDEDGGGAFGYQNLVLLDDGYLLTLHGFGLGADGALVRYGDTYCPTGGALLNISTRLAVQSGDNVLIAGFIVTGTDPKRVIVRGLGPSLSNAGVQGALADPTLELFDSVGTLVASNNNWKDSQQGAIEETTIPPGDDLEAAIVADLPANNSAYTAVLRGFGGGTGIGLVEAYDLAQSANSRLANISTRGFVNTGDDVLIGGFIVSGESRVVVRAIGPSLRSQGVADALGDTTLRLVDANGAEIRANDNWKDTQQAELEALQIGPGDELESAVVANLAGGSYTAIVRGKDGTTGVGLVEVYNLQ